MEPRSKHLKEVCKNCRCTFGSHCGSGYHSGHYKMYIPLNYCPGDEGRMNWGKGPGTTFEPSGEYKEDNNA